MIGGLALSVIFALINKEDFAVMEEPRMDHILQVGLGFWASKTLLSAVEMELFTELAKHPETCRN